MPYGHDELVARAQRSPAIRKLALRIGALTFVITAVVTTLGLSLTAYRTGFAPTPQTYRTGTVSVQECTGWAWQLGLVQRCVATVERWDPASVRPGLDLTDAPQVVVISRTPVSGQVEVASRKGFVTDRVPGGTVQVASEVIMPTDQQPWPSWLSALAGVGCLVVAFGATVLAARLTRPWLLRRAAAELDAGGGR